MGRTGAEMQQNLPEMEIAPRAGTYARGQENIELILQAALSILIEEGYRAVSFRRIARACGMTVGNVTYYYASKDELVRELVSAVIKPYVNAFDAIMADTALTAEGQLAAIVRLILEDIQTKKTTHLFPELWALANFEPFVADMVNYAYAEARRALIDVVGRLNPELPPAEREILCLFISGSMEGMTMFAGHQKQFAKDMPWLENIAVRSFVTLARTITAEEIRGGTLEALAAE